MASGTGIRIHPEYTHRFNDICDALEAAGIEYSLWNAEAMLDTDYSGPIDLNCDNASCWGDFERIVKSFVESQTAAEGTD